MAGGTMRAVRFDRFGEPAEVLRVEEVAVPEPGAGEVRVRMRARPVNPSDLFAVRGLYGILPKLPATGGMEGAGVVDRVGEGVTGVREGQMVVPFGGAGTWQEYVVADAKSLIPLPPGLSDAQAATAVINPASAWLMLREELGVREGEWLLQNAANSAVGTLVIQLARRFGFRTVNVVRRREVVERLREAGADEVICEGDEDVVRRVDEITRGKGVRHALDSVGGESGSRLAKCLGAGGTMLVFGAISGRPLSIDPGPLLFRGGTIRGWWLAQWFRTASPEAQARLFGELFPLLREGALAAPIAAEYDLADAVEAVRASESSPDGKVLLVG